jgi:hypothetical protein
MSPITSVTILHVDKSISTEFIADVFRRNRIAKVSDILLKSSAKSSYNEAYITIDYWYDNETAYNFIRRLQDNSRETRLIYNDDLWWTVCRREER